MHVVVDVFAYTVGRERKDTKEQGVARSSEQSGHTYLDGLRLVALSSKELTWDKLRHSPRRAST